MLITTNAIVLNHFKQGEKGIICNLYCQKEGFLSFWTQATQGKNKKQSTLLPLTQVEVVYKQNQNHQSLHFFQSIETKHHYATLYENPIKTAIVFFLTEILQVCLKKDGNQNAQLFQTLEKNLVLFDKKPTHFSEFHLYLLVVLIDQMGIFPDLTHFNYPYFDLQNGKFCLTIEKSSELLSESEKPLFLKIFGLDFSMDSRNELTPTERKNGINLLMRYLALHIDNFKQPNSLEILRQL
jgi:DNA repair protein RecO (recombination protein O)